MSESATRAPKTGGRSFQNHAVAVLSRLKGAMAEIVSALPRSIGSATDLQRLLDLDTKLSWRVFKVATAMEPLAAGIYVPGAASMKRVLEAAAEQGVASGLLRSAEAAFDAFEEMVREHAGDRPTFDSMVSAFAAEGAGQIDLSHRRGAFRANSHIWGLQARTQLKCSIVQPSAESPLFLDLIQLQGYVSLRRFRLTATQIISRLRSDSRHAIDPTARRPLVPGISDGHNAVSLLPQFCSRPTPEVRVEQAPSGDLRTELVASGIGNESKVTYMIGDIFRNLPGPYSDDDKPGIGSVIVVPTPTEILVHDVLIHEDVFGVIPAHVGVYNLLGHADPMQYTDADLLTKRETVPYLGKGLSVVHTPDVPRYGEMLTFAFDRLGWDADRFDVYRCRIEYPVVSATVVVDFDIPPTA